MRIFLAFAAVAVLPFLTQGEASAQWLVCQVKGTKQCAVTRKCAPPSVAMPGLDFPTRQRACAWAQDKRKFDEDAFALCGRRASGC
jgi:hypothetical protein